MRRPIRNEDVRWFLGCAALLPLSCITARTSDVFCVAFVNDDHFLTIFRFLVSSCGPAAGDTRGPPARDGLVAATRVGACRRCGARATTALASAAACT